MHTKITPGPWLPHALYPAILVSSHAPTLSLLTVDSAGAARFISPDDCRIASAAVDMADALEIVAQDDDAARRDGRPFLTSAVRAAVDAALIKAGRKAAPEPVRHLRACGENL